MRFLHTLREYELPVPYGRLRLSKKRLSAHDRTKSAYMRKVQLCSDIGPFDFGRDEVQQGIDVLHGVDSRCGPAL